MKSPKALYILIALFCVFSIIAGVYAQFIETAPKNTNTPVSDAGNTVVEKDRETIKMEFNNLFTNVLNANGFDATGIPKIVADKEIVYSAYDIQESKEMYELNVNIPVININDNVANAFNKITQATFANKVNEIVNKEGATQKTIYSVDYTAYVNGDVLSVAIKSTLKEGDSAQRVMVQTYNYNLTSGISLNLNDLVTKKVLNKDEVNTKIMQVVQEADNEAKAIEAMGYNTAFSRNLTDTMYTVDNSGTFFLGDNNKLYIIYAYGNQNFTSEMDIVVIE